MTKTGQNFRCGFFDLPPAYRMKAIKNAGFDGTMLWWGDDFSDTDGEVRELYEQAVKIGLSVDTAHFPSTESDSLWYGKERGAAYVYKVCKAVKDCGQRNIENLVMHLTRKTVTPPPNEIGTENFKKIVEAAEKNGVKIAVENTRFLEYNDYILQRVDSPSIGFCFDSGHANCYTPACDPLTKYGSMLCTTHIHDNNGPGEGEPDEHHLIGEGNVDFDTVFTKLKRFNAKYYNLESYCNATSIFYGKLGIDEFLGLSYKRLTEHMSKVGALPPK